MVRRRLARAGGFQVLAGPTIVYAFMQATGMVNDHLVKCLSATRPWPRPPSGAENVTRKPTRPARSAAIRSPARLAAHALSGRRLDLLDPSPLDIEIEDIAHGPSRAWRAGTARTAGAQHFFPWLSNTPAGGGKSPAAASARARSPARALALACCMNAPRIRDRRHDFAVPRE